MNLLTIDFESTGKDPLTARPIEFGYASPDDGAYHGGNLIALPAGETIPPETSAVHHIIDADLVGAPDWAWTVDYLLQGCSMDGPIDVVLIAHSAQYEQGILHNTPLRFGSQGVTWICTYKCALVAWPEAPGHGNEVLRYWLGFGTGRSKAQAPHSAEHDARVTAGIFNSLYGVFHRMLVDRGRIPAEFERLRDPDVQDAIIGEMARVSSLPAQLPTCPIGDWYGRKWSEVDAGFLRWMINKPIDREDAIHCAKLELARRAG